MDGCYKYSCSSLSRYILRELDCPPRQSQNQLLGSCTQSLLHRDTASNSQSADIFLYNSSKSDEYFSVGIISRSFEVAKLGVESVLCSFKRNPTELTYSLSVELPEQLHGQENPPTSLQATVLFPAISTDTGFIIQISAHTVKRRPLHYATSCHVSLSYHFIKPSAENTQLWWKSALSNQLSRINIDKPRSFLTENENLTKQPPDATSSSDSEPDFSPSPRPQTYGLRPSRGSIPMTPISPPTSI
ncbi:hypothetical protein AVEN_248059-1 [Araneus ventricosus]|uniref:Uncharacterized protein n=1 Tax=Araneus ventricosus TaxID=182803 RepID=A0A4Y2T583_ARAVE|nr:hypothetical protein AVEN_55574-1 [Araneus ventricosus]GBO02428.1 hypothetical protein AVEN_248059-1 [Araneus ventricosus]